MDLRKLRHLVAVSRRMSFSRAAEDLGLSQSALTRSIQSLERQAGMRLFDRDRAGVSLTAQGRLVVERASGLLADADDFERQLLQTAKGEDGRVCFGMAPLPAWTLLPTALSARISTVPGFTNEVVVRNVEGLWPLLIAGDIEFFVSVEGQVPDAPPVRAETLGFFPFNQIFRAGHPLLMGGDHERAFPILISTRGGVGKELFEDLHDRTIWPPHVVEDYGTLVMLTKTTDAIWVSSVYSIAQELEAGELEALDQFKIRGPRTFRMVIYSLDRRSQSPGMLQLKQVFRQRIKELEKPTAPEQPGPVLSWDSPN